MVQSFLSATIQTGMQTVVFDNKEYIKASVIAKRFNYTSDYIGQLCRAEKVEAKLVGRSWYVTLDSINTHRKGRYKIVEEKPQKEGSNKLKSNYLSRIDVEPILNKKIVKILQSKDGQQVEKSVRYEADDNMLIPKVDRTQVSKSVPIYPAGAEILRVPRTESKATLYKPEPKATFVLSGSLAVSDYPEIEVEESPELSPTSEPKTAEITSKQRPEVKKFTPVINHQNLHKSVPKVAVAQNQTHSAQTKLKKTNFSPKSYSQVVRRTAPVPVAAVKPKTTTVVTTPVPAKARFSLVVIIGITILSVALGLLLFSVTSEVVVTQVNYSSNLVLEFSTISETFERLFIHIKGK